MCYDMALSIEEQKKKNEIIIRSGMNVAKICEVAAMEFLCVLVSS